MCDSFCIMHCVICVFEYTVEPLNNVTFGTSYSVHYRPFFGGYKCVSAIYRKVTFWDKLFCSL